MEKPLTFDFRQHFADWRNVALPIFVIVTAIAIVLVIGFSGENPARDTLLEPGRVGLLDPNPDAVFDPAFAPLTPIEIITAPKFTTVDFPVGTEHGGLSYNAQPFLTTNHLGDDLNGIGGQNSDLGDPVYAITDGLVTLAGWPSDGWGNVVILAHRLSDGTVMNTFYGHLDTIRVPVGKQVRRGDPLGTIGNAAGRYLAHLHLEIRRYPTLDVGVGYADSRLGRISGELALRKWRARADDQLAEPPSGAPVEPRALSLDGIDAEPES